MYWFFTTAALCSTVLTGFVVRELMARELALLVVVTLLFYLFFVVLFTSMLPRIIAATRGEVEQAEEGPTS